MRINFVLIFFIARDFWFTPHWTFYFGLKIEEGAGKYLGEMGDWGRRFPRAHIYFYCFLMRRAAEEVFFFCCCPTAFGLRTDPIVEQWIFWDYLHTQRKRDGEGGGDTNAHATQWHAHNYVWLYVNIGSTVVEEWGSKRGTREGVVGGNLGRCGGALF